MLQYRRDDLENYLYSMIDLATLDVFIDEELIYLSDLLKKKQMKKLGKKCKLYIVFSYRHNGKHYAHI